MKILMVCLGNICRSPLADGLLRMKVRNHGLSVIVDSAGTSNFHIGEPPDSRMCKTAASFGVHIDELRARQFSISDFENFDMIYAMDKSNLNNLLKLARHEQDRQKVNLILNEINPTSDSEVPDPYYEGQEGFIHVYHLLDEATDKIIERIIEHAKR